MGLTVYSQTDTKHISDILKRHVRVRGGVLEVGLFTGPSLEAGVSLHFCLKVTDL